MSEMKQEHPVIFTGSIAGEKQEPIKVVLSVEFDRLRAVALELLEEYIGEKFALDSQFNSVRLEDYDILNSEWKAKIMGEQP